MTNTRDYPGDDPGFAARRPEAGGDQDRITLYGIPNCDTVKKARAWLDAAGIPHAFHDYKKVGIDAGTLGGWVDRLGWETVLNRAGTTFRKLPEAARADLTAETAITLMLGNPSMIKRPMLVRGEVLLAGFKPEIYAERLIG